MPREATALLIFLSAIFYIISFLGSVLPSSFGSWKESDSPLLVTRSMKHCEAARIKSNAMTVFTARCLECKAPGVVLTLYNSIVRLHPEHAVQLWFSHYRKDIEFLERVERRDIKIITSLILQPIEERLKKFNAFYLEKRRLRDLLHVCKYFKKLSDVDH